MKKVMLWVLMMMFGWGGYVGMGHYVNDRYGFSVDYPGHIFTQKRIPDAGDGIMLLGRNGLEFRAYGSMYEERIAEAYRDTNQWERESGSRITYKKLSRNWFVVSGILKGGEKLFYQKTFFKNGVSVTMRFVYRVRDKHLYDPLVEEMMKGVAF
jgi:hypothetical protein